MSPAAFHAYGVYLKHCRIAYALTCAKKDPAYPAYLNALRNATVARELFDATRGPVNPVRWDCRYDGTLDSLLR